MTDAQERRRVTRPGRLLDRVTVLGALVAAVAFTALVFDQLAPFGGVIGFAVLAWIVFLGLYALLVSLTENALTVRDRLVSAVVYSLAAFALLALVTIVAYPVIRGVDALSHLNFFTQDMATAGPLDPLSQGGVLHAVVGTLEQIAIALAVTVPLGLTCAVYLNEVRGTFARLVRTIVDAMTALPSIVAGLFVYAALIVALGLEKSGLAAGCAISVMMLPIVIRAADVVIRLVPGNLREASLALGAGRLRTAWHVVLPTARSGLTTAILLGTARGIGETSPVLITAGFTAYLNADPLTGPQISLPLATFSLVTSPEEAMKARGFGAAAVLMLLVLVVFVIARIAGGRPAGELSRGALRRRARASAADRERFDGRMGSGS
ncbi:phosphate ABC transporter permease [Amycolatopsis mediterranei S699]|uniref:Phosphate transport system permease protein PstA n=3 Tax=Amycolatopsis mediterranei TaxID=33910 RepID=A0A0H3D8U7_AMYMU|nr:phosphate ABC transporter permease PstA [Amycolatopsis mediterranei]ADJ47415.1 permease component of ABC-type phosphate transport system [Amycolatopsis mediterranei U32]AEK44261.1 phosphate ABC transporter permease [Amycolatopsis mediterranei S699]AFO79126.1 phosphate ABC transporter permease [Amycolatopsis mediterranei S699]AGT86254.1 phosphate ABC transporter permease [Amycolatopsis mediterranei RB]KDO12659.1 phosphate ABC transporter permease [Amycolatopsis mediterranei]